MKQKSPVIRYIVLALFICASGGLLLHTSQLVQHKEAELKSFKSALEREKQMVGVLEAEWAQLNSPARLEDLVRDHLDLQMPDTESIAPEFADLPEARDAFILDEVDNQADDLKVDVVATPAIAVPARKPRTIPMKSIAKPAKEAPAVRSNEAGGASDITDLIKRLNSGEGAP